MKLSIYVLCILSISMAEDIYHTPSAIVLKPALEINNESLFGFSVAYLKDDKPRLIVSAPRANNFGQIFQCILNEKNNLCHPINISNRVNFGKKNDHGVWLGASVSAGSSFYVVCAPRCLEHYKPIASHGWPYLDGLFGLCLVGEKAEPLRPLPRMTKHDREKLEYPNEFERITDGLGWTTFVSSQDAVLVGGPPMGTGKFVVYESPLDFQKKPVVYSKVNMARYNLGYSVVSGNFIPNNTEKEQYAVSSIYGVDGTGKVILMDNKKNILYSIYGENSNLGAMFGACLCAANVLGDAHAELLVGAPAHAPSVGQTDTGAVHIYTSDGLTMIYKNTLSGPKSGGYFGYAIANLGDVEGDGYHDVAVSAPFEADGLGAVYIFSGRALASQGTVSPLQRLSPEPTVRGFGLALTTLADYDDNGCNELGVGAADSNSVMVYHCFSPINIELQPVFPDLTTLPVDATNFTFQSCVNVIYPLKPINITADLLVKVEIIHNAAQLANASLKDNSYEYRLSLNTKLPSYCTPISVNTDTDGDFSEMLQYIISAVQIDDPRLSKDFNSSRVVISSQSVHNRRATTRGCGAAGCQSQLQLHLNWNIPDLYVVGSTARSRVSIRVDNSGDSSYAACVRIVVVGAPVWAAPAYCIGEPQNLTCTQHTPLHKNSIWDIGNLTLEMNYLTSLDSTLRVEASLHEPCTQVTSIMNVTRTSTLVGDAKGVAVNGWTNHEEVIHFTNSQFESGYVSRLTHIYEISNTGVTKWVNLRFTLQLESKPYAVFETIKVYTKTGATECDIPSEGARNVSCPLTELSPKSKHSIYLHLRLVPKHIDTLISSQTNFTISSSIHLDVQNLTRYFSVSNLMSLNDEAVPWWLIALGVVLGVLMAVFFIYGLHTMGFFGRKTKKKLENLKIEINRRSMAAQSASTTHSNTRKSKNDYEAILNDQDLTENEI